MKNIIREVSAEFDGIRISDYLRRGMGLSVTLIKRVKFGGVFIGGENVHMRAIVHTGDTVEVRLPEAKSENIRPKEPPSIAPLSARAGSLSLISLWLSLSSVPNAVPT